MTVEGESVFTGNSAAFDGGEGNEQLWCGQMLYRSKSSAKVFEICVRVFTMLMENVSQNGCLWPKCCIASKSWPSI